MGSATPALQEVLVVAGFILLIQRVWFDTDDNEDDDDDDDAMAHCRWLDLVRGRPSIPCFVQSGLSWYSHFLPPPSPRSCERHVQLIWDRSR